MFKKDFLMFDIEATGTDVTKHEIIQLAGVLLDKKTLQIKKEFNEFIKPKKWANRDPEAMQVNKIDFAKVKNAKALPVVLKKFIKHFNPQEVILTNYGGNLDVIFLPAAFRNSKIKYPFDYHTFNFWPLCYTFMAKNKNLKNKEKFAGFSLEEVAKKLGVKSPQNRHDALADCYFQTIVLQNLIKKLKII